MGITLLPILFFQLQNCVLTRVLARFFFVQKKGYRSQTKGRNNRMKSGFSSARSCLTLNTWSLKTHSSAESDQELRSKPSLNPNIAQLCMSCLKNKDGWADGHTFAR